MRRRIQKWRTTTKEGIVCDPLWRHTAVDGRTRLLFDKIVTTVIR
jgi:hypothetical protein